MLTWVRDLSENLGFIVVTTKFDNGGNGRKGYVALGCQKGGKYWEYAKKKREAKITLKGGCPFKLKSYLLSTNCWGLNVVNGEYNHDMPQNFQCHKYVGRLRPEEKELIRKLTDNMATPRNIMATLKYRQKTTATMKYIYNSQYRILYISNG
jgi:hypothetical protein